jgi:hypothetical protein
MKNFLIIIFLLASAAAAFSQPGNKREKMESFKIAYITERLNLKPEQAEKFWPLYNEFHDKRIDLRKEQVKLRTENINNLTSTDEELTADLKKLFELKQQELNLEKDFFEKAMKVITVRQVVELHRAEKQFAVDLLKRIQERKGK